MTEIIYAITALAAVIAVIFMLYILLVCIRRLKTKRRSPGGASFTVAVSAIGKALEAGADELKAQRFSKRTPPRSGDMSSPVSNGS